MERYQKTFVKFAFPAVMSMIVNTLYVIVDGIFVSRFVGPEALASVNIVWPFINFVLAIAMMIAIGGGALVSINLGANDIKRANNMFFQSIMFGVLALASVSLLAIIFARPLSFALGADETVVDGCVEYLRYYLMFGVPFGLAPILAAFLRNDKAPAIAFLAMVMGAVSNIFLDYLLVYVIPLGLKGAAIASGIGQVISCLLAIGYFAQKKGQLRFKKTALSAKSIGRMIKAGSPEFIVEMCVPISMIAYNIVIMQRLGYLWVSSYGIIMYIMTFSICMFAGLSHGMQPIISRYYGMQDTETIKKVFRLGLTTSVVIAVLTYLLLWFFGKKVIGVFTTDQAMISMTYDVLIWFAINIPFAAVNIICITYFQAQTKTQKANIISYNRGLTFNLLFIILLPILIGDRGIWIALACTEAATFIVAVLCLLKQRKEDKTNALRQGT